MRNEIMYRYYMLDLDGTLINTTYALAYMINLTPKKYGLGSTENEQTEMFVRDGYQKFAKRALRCCGGVELARREDALMTYGVLFGKHCLYRIEVYDGVKELLDVLKAGSTKIAAVTNKSHDRAIENVEIVFGKDYSDRTTREQEDTRCKPDLAVALGTTKALGVDPLGCLYLDDANIDMKTGINAGVDTMDVPWGFWDREELEALYPRYIIEHPGDILPAIGTAR